ncbi:MAG: hypothetical protein HY220_03655 [Candidatus Sungbacteria bacterium]|uniref:Uncharacterized protein n=1 Tax=Candidatus Sungiibacteriota bacterium TaxID=2750080 RepID=A0A9D6QYW4_9BACT|nr:hypothetical protein [Candidatus Sungbacteria bacterium]
MKTLVVLAFIVLAFYGYRYLPASIKSKTDAFLAASHLEAFGPSRWLPALGEASDPYAEKLHEGSPVVKREKLIQDLKGQIQIMASTHDAKTNAERAQFTKAGTEAKSLLDQLETENPNSGFLRDIAFKILEAILPSASSTAICNSLKL